MGDAQTHCCNHTAEGAMHVEDGAVTRDPHGQEELVNPNPATNMVVLNSLNILDDGRKVGASSQGTMVQSSGPTIAKQDDSSPRSSGSKDGPRTSKSKEELRSSPREDRRGTTSYRTDGSVAQTEVGSTRGSVHSDGARHAHINLEVEVQNYPGRSSVDTGHASTGTGTTQRTSASSNRNPVSNYATDKTPVMPAYLEDEDDDEITCAGRVDDILNNSMAWSIFVCVLTVWALFADDLRVLFLPKHVDVPMLIVSLFILLVFLVEFSACWVVQSGYAWSMGAMMDLLAALSLIPLEELFESIGGFSDSVSVARVARAARALRILRATRAAAMALKAEHRIRRLRRIMQKGHASVLEDTLIQSTNIKVLLAILVLLMGGVIIDFNASEQDLAASSGLKILDQLYEQMYLPSPASVNASHLWTSMWHEYRSTVEGDDGSTLRKLITLEVRGVTYLSLPTDSLRNRDIVDSEEGEGFAQVSKEGVSKRQAVHSLILTIFIVLVIVLWAWSFRRDHEQWVIKPVNQMVDLLKEMETDPLKAIDKSLTNANTVSLEARNEMDVIESCIAKFGSLLKVGFGEAGMGIISRNMGQKNFDPVVPGVIVKAVFGFCDIRNFTDCCEVLRTDTMIFTNSIARIVHDLVEDSGGSVNKNIGDAFLSVWKLKEEKFEDANESSENDDLVASHADKSIYTSASGTSFPGTRSTPRSPRSFGGSQSSLQSDWRSLQSTQSAIRSRRSFLHHLTGATDTCDSALRSFLHMNEVLRTSDSIQKLAADPRLQNKLPGYTVRMGSGLHLGWAIEGAVGTSHKVDATYLSPHVNMAARLEAATKQYGVSILMSEAIVNAFTLAMQSECRPVDRVTVKGSVKPMTLYVHLVSETPELDETQRTEFKDTWIEAFGLYQSGSNWSRAAELMKICLEILPRDTPAKVLLEVIDAAGGKAPRKWPGYRELTSK